MVQAGTHNTIAFIICMLVNVECLNATISCVLGQISTDHKYHEPSGRYAADARQLCGSLRGLIFCRFFPLISMSELADHARRGVVKLNAMRRCTMTKQRLNQD